MEIEYFVDRIRALTIINDLFGVVQESSKNENFWTNFREALNIVYSEFGKFPIATTVAIESLSQVKDERVFELGSSLLTNNQAVIEFNLWTPILSNLMIVHSSLFPDIRELPLPARVEKFGAFIEDNKISNNPNLVKDFMHRMILGENGLRKPVFEFRMEEVSVGEHGVITDSEVIAPGGSQASKAIRPGDGVFRELNIWGFPEFGHVGIYVGHPDEGVPLKRHYIAEMKTGFMGFSGNCVLTTFEDFISTSPFWGVYSMELTEPERKQLFNAAMNLVGRCGYALTYYKDPYHNLFRCDGFVEHLYESLNPMPIQLQHRNGLFEDDTYDTLNPNALRSCFSDRVVGKNFSF